MQLLVIFLYILFLQMPIVMLDVISSTANLLHLVEAELELVDDFEKYVAAELVRIEGWSKVCEDSSESDCNLFRSDSAQVHQLGRYVLAMKQCHDVVRAKGSLFYAGHPLNAYHLVKRWQWIINTTQKDERISPIYKGLPVPSEEDVEGAVSSLLILQRVYALETEDMFFGKVQSEVSVHAVTKDDCELFGKVALQMGDYGLAIQWGEMCRKIHGISDLAGLHILTRAYLNIKDYKQALVYAAEAVDMNPENAQARSLYSQCEALTKSHGVNYVASFTGKTWDRNLVDWQINYERLCRGELDATTDPEYAKDLCCRYKRSEIPYVVFKEEILSWDPKISLFYEVISKTEADHVINAAYPKLYRATVGDQSEAFATSDRIGKVAWLWDAEHPLIKHLSYKVSLVTGLDTTFSQVMSRAEPFQVVNYGIGGQYTLHVDFYENKKQLSMDPDFLRNSGDRLLTFLYYLTDVRYGGATIFPRLNLRVPPMKFGAAVWYNAKLSGEYDSRTEHAGCPVLVGQKWISNKWIRERGQEFRRPCGLTPDAVDKS